MSEDNKSGRSRRGKGRHPSQSRKPPSPGWESRLAAAELILTILDKGLDMDGALGDSQHYDALEGADRGFARAIASSTLRALGRIDRALSNFLDRPIAKIDPPVLALLRTGAAQLWVMDAPAYAVVSATVDAARQWRPAARGGGLVNAILRRADRERGVYKDLDATTIWPDWLATRLTAALGPERAERLARFQLEEPHTDLTVKSDPAGWADKLEAELLASGSIRLPTGAPITELEGYAEGEWWVQDAGAALPARLFGDVVGRSVADLCAAPGGKTLQLCAMGADVTALDLDPARMARIEDNLERTQLQARSIVADAATWRPDAPFDAILLDAPCSALGTLRRHPEGAWRRSPKGLARYPRTQTGLINAAWEMLKPGGTLVYCVCTPLPEEGADIIDAALAGGGWTLQPIAADEAPGYAHALTPEGWLLTAPPPDESDGSVSSDVFFIARLQRV